MFTFTDVKLSAFAEQCTAYKSEKTRRSAVLFGNPNKIYDPPGGCDSVFGNDRPKILNLCCLGIDAGRFCQCALILMSLFISVKW